jgi:hypothetical protein
MCSTNIYPTLMKLKYKHLKVAASVVASHIAIKYYGPLRSVISFIANLFHNT